MAGAKSQVRNRRTLYSRRKLKKMNISSTTSTPGKIKCESCQTNSTRRWGTKRGRAYKNKEYMSVVMTHEKIRQSKGEKTEANVSYLK